MPVAAPPSDADLLAACRTGDERAWRTLVERYGGLALSVAHRCGLRGPHADDVFSDVFTALVSSLRTIRDPERLPGWIVRTATRCAWHARRRRGHELVVEHEAAVPEPADLVAQLEAERLVREALGRLPERCRKLLQALYFEPHTPSYDELARTTGTPRGSLGPTRSRCLEKLRTHVEPLAELLGSRPEGAPEVPDA